MIAAGPRSGPSWEVRSYLGSKELFSGGSVAVAQVVAYQGRRQDARRAKLDAGRLMSAHSQLRSVQRCGTRSRGGAGIGIGLAADGSAHYAGALMCGSVWSCPVCASKVLAGRVDEIAQVLRAWDARGGAVAMVTLTMRHDVTQGLAELWAGVGRAWTAATNGHGEQRQRWRQVDGWLRRLEVTYGSAGWHVHVHALLFLDRRYTDEQLIALGDGMFDAWSRRLVGLGFASPDRRLGGLDVRRLDLSAGLEAVAGYQAKGSFESVALEVAGQKAGRRANRTPMQILRDCLVGGDIRDWRLWREWELASHGKRAITWKRGFRAQILGVAPDVTDEQLANEGSPLTVVAVVAPEHVRALRNHPYAYASALVVVENSTVDDAYERLCRWFERWGLSPPLRPPIIASYGRVDHQGAGAARS